MTHDYRPVPLATEFSWQIVSLGVQEFAGPRLSFEQCARCSVLRCSSDEGIVRWVSHGGVVRDEPACGLGV